jgi:hypothetical protein
MNDLALAGALATAPTSAFNELRERPRFWFPLLLIVLTTAAVMYWYYSTVDIEWLKDAMFSNNPKMQQLPEAQRAAAMGAVGRGTMLWGSVIGVIVAIPFFFVLGALYLLVAAKVTKLPFGFKHWFSFTCWTALPMVLSCIVSALLLALRDSNQVSPGILQPMSINQLLVHLPIGSPGQSLLESLTIPALLSWVLSIFGVHVWSQRSWTFSAIFAMLPNVLLYGIWAIFAFR